MTAHADAAGLIMPDVVEKEATFPGREPPFVTSNGLPLTEEARTKVYHILVACGDGGHGQDPSSLVALATSAGGLIDDEVRRVACTSTSLLRPDPSQPVFRATAIGI